MRVLHVTSGRLFGGVEQMLLTLARCRAGAPEMEPAFAVAAPGRLEQELRESGADLVPLGDVKLSRPASMLRARVRLARAIDAARPAAVVCHAPWSYAIFARVARRKRVPVVLWQHDRATGTTFVERWARRVRADLVIGNSQWTARSAVHLQPGVPIAVIHPPVTLNINPDMNRAALRRSLNAGDREVVILTASRMEPWKGHANVLRALGAMREHLAWTLWIAGGAQRDHEREYVGRLEALALDLGIASRVRFLGERRDIPALMDAANLFCQMNEGPEPFGIVFAEALLSQLPVVAADLGGAPEIVSKECGRLVPAGDIAALTATLSTLVDDAELRRGLGSKGPRHAAERTSPEVVLPQIARAVRGLTAAAAA